MNWKEYINYLLDFVLPRTAEERLLDGLNAESFVLKVKPCQRDSEDIIALFEYRNKLVKAMLWRLKFKGDRRLASLAAALIHDHLIGQLEELNLFANFGKPVIVPVPLSVKRRRKRGFNQCELIADQLEKIDGGTNFKVVKDAVVKIKETLSQTSLGNKAERQKNLLGCFAVSDQKAIRGHSVIVLDDIYTTGSTFAEMKRILVEAGAKKIIGLTFAH